MTVKASRNISSPKRFLLITILTWSSCVLIAWFMISISGQRTQVEHTAIHEAHSFLAADRTFRLWAASHGGVYVPSSSKTPPNPYLAHIPNRDLSLDNGKGLTLMNPAYMLRQLHEEYSEALELRGHITSLDPIRPENAPADWERRALGTFKTGNEEFVEFTKVDGHESLRMMQPLVTQEGCLKCHAHQGYKVGDIRGGISITFPLTELWNEARQHRIYWSLSLLLLWLLGLAGIWFSSRRIIAEIEAKDEAYGELEIYQHTLEQNVRDRTKSVEEANAQLEEEVEERAKIQDALESSHGELEQIFNSAADGMRIVDWDHNVIKFNDTFARMAGGSRLSLGGRKCYEIFPGLLCHTEECPLQEARNGEKATSRETIKTSLDGNTIHCLSQSTIFYDSAGSPMGILESFRDISEFKKLEQELSEEAARTAQQAVELQQKNTDIISQNVEIEQALHELKATQSQMLQNEKMATVGQLAAGVAHEINNPTGFVTSNLSTLEKYVQRITDFLDKLAEMVPAENEEEISKLRKKMKIDHITEDIHDLIEESLDGTERIKKIVMSLKNFSRQDHEEYGQTDINDCLDSTLNVVWNELKYKVTVDKEYGELPLTRCYAQQLNQVFMNLLVNSAQAIEEQGVITIKTWTDDAKIFISVADTGSGMDEETMARIFDPFYTTKGKDKGTGLGLSIAHDIITKKHHGRLCVESRKGQGTTFIIEIPVVEE
ncbi:MAG: ATP-binding protein [Thermodesulfobacteriota bacterium]